MTAKHSSSGTSFTSDWWSSNIPVWKAQFPDAAARPLRMLEIGSFEGRSAVWFADNILAHAHSQLTCVDTFEGSHEHSDRDLSALEATCRGNLARFGDKVTILKGRSWDILRQFPRAPQFDIIYIDGEHHAASVLEDAVLAFPLLVVGGRMVFDDYGATRKTLGLPRAGIDAFLSVVQDRVRVDATGWQLFLTKLSSTCNEAECACTKRV